MEGFTNALQEIGYQGIRKGDLVIHSMDGFAGAIGVSDSDGKASPVVNAYSPREGGEPRYYAYVLRELARSGFITSLAKGIRERSTAFDNEMFRSLMLPSPPLDEQRAIADFLDAETARIDALMEKKQRMLQLLDERFRVLVDDVAKTLPFECPIKRVGTVTYGLGQPPAPADAGVPIIRATNIDRGVISTADLVFANQDELPWDRCPPLRLGEILVVRSGALTGDSAMVTSDWIGAAPGYDLRVTPQSIVPAALAFQLLGTDYSRQIDLVRSRAAQPHLNADDLGNIVVRRGTQDEEEHASQVILRASSTRNRLSSLVQTQIGLLTEHRRGVITAAVTGELTIAGVAA